MSRIVEWLTSLENGKRTVAILLFGIIALFGMLTRSEYKRSIEREQAKNEITALQAEIIARTDIHSKRETALILMYTTSMEDNLKAQLDKYENVLLKTNKIVKENDKLIKKIKSN